MQFRDVLLASQEHDTRFKKETFVIPCVTCTAVGVTEDSDGNPVSAVVTGEPDYVWVKAYNDSVPSVVLNNNKINPQTGLLVYIGYIEGSTQQEIIGLNDSVLDVDADTTNFSPFSGVLTFVTRDMFPILKTTPSSGLIVSVSALEYDRYGGREVVLSTTIDLTAYKPASGYVVWVLVYLDAKDGVVEALSGVAVRDIASVSPSKPDTPIDGIASAYVKLLFTTTTIIVTDIAEAKRFTTPNVVPGLSYNLLISSLTIPGDYTMIRGQMILQGGQVLIIENTGRMVLL